jgi:hypothetical protein
VISTAMRTSHATAVVRYLAVDLVGAFAYWPVWWYSRGLVRTLRGCVDAFVARAQMYGVGIWFRNLFVPMYGQRDLFSRAISVVLRLVVIAWYSFLLAAYAVLLAAVAAVWILFPAAVVFMVVHQLSLLTGSAV